MIEVGVVWREKAKSKGVTTCRRRKEVEVFVREGGNF